MENQNVVVKEENKVTVEIHKEEKPVNKKMKLKVMANLRSDSKVDSKNVMGILPKDAVVEIISKEGKFSKVKYMNRLGYVMTKLLVEY